MFPNAKIVGVDIDEDSLSIARLRSRHYKSDNVTFLLSPSSDDLPFWFGNFDYANLSGVYEHLLPQERKILLLKIWSHIKSGGILFINQTPHRYFPVETHAAGLPLINYLPDRVTLQLARKYSRRIRPDESWEDLLRKGIRGATVKEISNILNTDSLKPIFLEPERLKMKDNIDLWYQLSNTARFPTLKKCFKSCLKILKIATGITITPSLSLAIKKLSSEEIGIS
jgi:ubiquinone/menaquinone biosynthesis C-methylase UbiE